MKFLLVFIFYYVNILSAFNIKAQVVKIQNGLISGQKFQDYDGENYYAFMSIPFAQPPIGKLRFQAPQPITNWEDVRNCTNDLPMCVQYSHLNHTEMIGTEDCLYLNVYTSAIINATNRKPVLVHIHGGGLNMLWGGKARFGPEFMMLDNDIVLVSINYRVNFFGFATLESENEHLISMNNGFKDQVLALRWVQDNIRQFGGDPNSVTISGTSAGSQSVHYHMFSPLSKGLFHKAIVRSPTGVLTYGLAPRNTLLSVAQAMNLPTNDLTKLIDLLQKAPLIDIFQALLKIEYFNAHLNPPMPVNLFIEKPGPNSFMIEDPLSLLQKGNFNKVPSLFSMTDMEGIFFMSPQLIVNNHKMRDLSTQIPALFGNNISIVQENVVNFYFKNNSYQYPYLELWGDVWFKYSTYKLAKVHSHHHPVYMYYFQLDTILNLLKPTIEHANEIEGACHADDEGYLLTHAGTPAVHEESKEYMWMKRVSKISKNFAIHGNPIPGPSEYFPNISWPLYTDNSRLSLNIQNIGLSIMQLQLKSFDFWDDMFRKYASVDYQQFYL